MMIVMKPTADQQEVAAVVERIESVGARAHVVVGDELTIIGAIGDREHVARLDLDGAPGVERIVPILKPYSSPRPSSATASAPCSTSPGASSAATTSR